MLPEPSPVPNGQEPLWGLVLRDWNASFGAAQEAHPLFPAIRSRVAALMEERDRFGREKYGTPLQAHNGRDMLTDAFQEALDLSVYLRGLAEEQKGKEWERPVLSAYVDALGLVWQLAAMDKGRT